ncbi:hypothetical protein DPMN_028037 [Dreissena polymorpha]|uniref:Uncharacterized protein n=1 Tax=Dreissena polymorpha TaxID=45954 RepID=A0A9D4REY2_DREPO|nr:hypothetical protein DPMN_028037 [Dreissena polymorpha]
MPPKKKDMGDPKKENINSVKSSGKNKKRKNALVSPDNLNVDSLPEKRSDYRASPCETMASQSQPVYMQPMNMSSMSNMNNYQSQPGAFYTPQQNIPPNTPYHINASPQMQPNIPPPTYNENFQKSVLDQLRSLDTRLNKLDSIETQLSNLTMKLSNMDVRVTSLEGTVRKVDSRVTDVETSRAFDSQTCEELKLKNTELDKALQAERRRIAELTSEFESLREVPDDIEDLRSRSMRCNLLFHGFPEEPSPAARRSENCAKTVLDHLVNSLEISHAHDLIKIERAHRLGAKYDVTKARPIVVMFNHYPDKMLVKQKAQEAWKKFNDSRKSFSYPKAPGARGAEGSDTPDANSMDETVPVQKPTISVSDQFPKTVQARRKSLLPAMINAKKSGKSAYLSYDKLYIDNKMYTTHTVSSSGFGIS